MPCLLPHKPFTYSPILPNKIILKAAPLGRNRTPKSGDTNLRYLRSLFLYNVRVEILWVSPFFIALFSL